MVFVGIQLRFRGRYDMPDIRNIYSRNRSETLQVLSYARGNPNFAFVLSA